MKTVGEIIGILGIAVNFLIYQQKNRNYLLWVKLLSDICWSLHYGLLGAYSGMWVCIIGATREISFILTENKKQLRKYFLIVFALVAITTSILSMKDPFGVLPAFASLIAVFSYWQQSPNLTKILGLPISGIMITYDVMRLSTMGLINEILTLISIIVFFVGAYFRKKNQETAQGETSVESQDESVQ